MHDWIDDELARYRRRTVAVLWSVHALRDKQLVPADIDRAVATVRTGWVVREKSDPWRKTICFKRYFKNNVTYFAVGGLHPDFIRIVTAIKVAGRV